VDYVNGEEIANTQWLEFEEKEAERKKKEKKKIREGFPHDERK